MVSLYLVKKGSCLIWLCTCYASQDPGDVPTLVELKVLSDLFIPPVPVYKDKGKDFLLHTYCSENAAYKIVFIAFSNLFVSLNMYKFDEPTLFTFF